MAANGNNNYATSTRNLTVLISGNGSNLQALIDACPSSSSSSSSSTTTSSTTNNIDSAPRLPPNTRIVHVISDRKDAYGLHRARQAGIPTTYHGILPYKKKFPDGDGSGEFAEARRAYDARLAELVLNGPSASSSSTSISTQAERDDKSEAQSQSQSQSQPNSESSPQSRTPTPELVICAGFMRILTPSFLLPLQHHSNLPIINLHPSLHGDLIGAHCIERAWEEFQQGKRKHTGVMVHYVIAEVDMGRMIVQAEVDIQGCASLALLEERMHAREHGLIVEGARMVLEGRG